MALITRLSRLFHADFHAVLDCIEEPDIQLKQAVREMQFELHQEEQQLALMQHEITRLHQLESQFKEKVVSFDEELDICFTANKDELARDLIKRKLETMARLETANNQRSDLQNSAQALTIRIEEYRDQLEVTKQKLEILLENNPLGQIKTKPNTINGDIRKEDIEIAFLREKQRREKQGRAQS
jgi:phage shock protein A